MLSRLLEIIMNPLKIIRPLGSRGFLNWIPDKTYLRLIYRAETGEKLNISNPKKYNEKIQWLKLYNRVPKYTKYVDKYLVRSFIEQKLGTKHLIPLIGVYESAEEIDWDHLPDQFVLKCTHGSGTNIICTDKRELDIEKCKKKLNNWLQKSWFWHGREWPYKNVKPRIICEEYMLDNDEQLKDYRIFCFNGSPKFITVDFDIIDKTNTRRNLYDLKWNLLEYGITYPRELNYKVSKPKKLDKMLEFSKILSKNIPHVRVDFYSIDEEIYFGEMTFYHQVGLGKIYPEEFEFKMGDWIELPSTKADE